jgi:alkaline phosphatase D
MTIPHRLLAIALFSCPATVLAGELVSGPMLGAVDHREALVWLEVDDATTVRADWWEVGAPAAVRSRSEAAPPPSPAFGQPLTLRLGPLEAGRHYEYRLFVDDREVALDLPRRFETPPMWEWRSGPPEVRFLAGSCAYFNDEPYDRPGPAYGNEPSIFDVMAKRDADLMLWLGDNTYLREGDYGSVSGIWARWRFDRAQPALRSFLASTSQYAIWDDHDFGPNDSDGSYPLKAASLEAFTRYWANPSWGLPGVPGVFGAFRRGDVAFFLLDGRFHRDNRLLDPAETPHKTQLGRAQLDWLKNALLFADADFGWRSTFKIIALGGQFLHDADGESYRQFEAERREILEFIARHQIGGVVFVTGDRHFSMVSRMIRPDLPPLWEVTCSPLTAGVRPREVFEALSEAKRDTLVPGTTVHERSFCEFRAFGPSDDRRLAVQIRAADGTPRVELELRAKDLGVERDADRRVK